MKLKTFGEFITEEKLTKVPCSLLPDDFELTDGVTVKDRNDYIEILNRNIGKIIFSEEEQSLFLIKEVISSVDEDLTKVQKEIVRSRYLPITLIADRLEVYEKPCAMEYYIHMNDKCNIYLSQFNIKSQNKFLKDKNRFYYYANRYDKTNKRFEDIINKLDNIKEEDIYKDELHWGSRDIITFLDLNNNYKTVMLTFFDDMLRVQAVDGNAKSNMDKYEDKGDNNDIRIVKNTINNIKKFF